MSLNLQDARRVLAAAEQKAIAIEQPHHIAVVDAGGHLVAFAHMDQA